MKRLRKYIAVLLALSLFCGMAAATDASSLDPQETAVGAVTLTIEPFASTQFDSCITALQPKGGGKMVLYYEIWGKYNPMIQIGAKTITIYEETGPDKWRVYATYSSRYTYGTMEHYETITFNAAPGILYKATITAYAKSSSGSDEKDYYTVTALAT